MMEIVYKDESKATKDKTVETLPKNIRQVGGLDHRLRVYLEDFACTYLQKTARHQPEETKLCILCGEERQKDGQPVLFIQSAALMAKARIRPDGMLEEPDWKGAEGLCRKYFPGQEILGWAVIAGGQEPVYLEQLKTLHRHHFTGGRKLLLWWESGEKEELLFGTGAEELMNLNGYYIYYEENRSMRDYMIAHNPMETDRVGEPEDRAVKDFRRVVEERQSTEPGIAGQLVRIAAAACVVFALAGVLNYVKNNQGEALTKSTAAVARQQWESETTENVEEAKASVFTSVASSVAETEAAEETAADTALLADTQTGTEETADTMLKAEGETEAADTDSTGESPLALEETNALGYTAYEVKTGDTISNISQAYYGTMSRVEEICALNHIDQQDLIYTGQILLLPQ
jgi:nucleoid-associated protein YgaU